MSAQLGLLMEPAPEQEREVCPACGGQLDKDVTAKPRTKGTTVWACPRCHLSFEGKPPTLQEMREARPVEQSRCAFCSETRYHWNHDCGVAHGHAFVVPATPPMRFDGSTFDPEQDGPRLSRQLAAVLAVMADGEWRSLAMLSNLTGAPETSVSARLRDLRKPRHGARTVERKRITAGLYRYRLVPENES